jgi:hypothetical protein
LTVPVAMLCCALKVENGAALAGAGRYLDRRTQLAQG